MSKGMVGFEQDISNILFSFQSGVMTDADLEMLMGAEKKRTVYATQISEFVSKEIEKVFTLYDKIVDCLTKNLNVPQDLLQVVFQYISKAMLSIRCFQKVVKSSSLTISSSIVSAEAELASAVEADKIPDMAGLLEQMSRLESEQKKKFENEDDNDSSSLFFKKKKDNSTQTPMAPPSHGDAHHHSGHYNSAEPSGGSAAVGASGITGISITGVNGSDKRRASTLPGQRPTSPSGGGGGLGGGGPATGEMSMSLRDTKYGIPGEPRKASVMLDGLQIYGANASNGAHTHPVSKGGEMPSKITTKKSSRGMLSMLNEDSPDPKDPQKNLAASVLGSMDATTIAEIEDKVS